MNEREARPRRVSSGPLRGAATLVLALLVAKGAAGFSTPRLASSIRQLGQTSGRGLGLGQPGDAEYEYLNNYITAIEDRATEPAGFMVSTTDHNYAIQSPRLGALNWQSFTVNGAQVFVLRGDNSTLSASLFALSESERDFIAESRSNFTQNLAGLKFAYYTSGSSLALPGVGGSFDSVESSASQSSQAGGSYLAPGHYGQTVASSNINRLNAALQVANRPGQDQPGGLHEPVPGRMESGELRYTMGEAPAPAQQVPANYDEGESAGFYGSRALSAASGTRKFKRKQRAQGGARQWSSYHSPPGAEYAPAHNRPGPQRGANRPVPVGKQSQCAFQSLVNFNYYNLNALGTTGPESLNRTLAGDIYYFDFHCNVLDVYSSSVSVRHLPYGSMLYRDHRYFSYSRSKLPLELNRLFLVGDQIFFVYNDGSVLLKQNWMLEAGELELVLQVRQQLKNISEWQARAGALIGRANQVDEPAGNATTSTTTDRPGGEDKQ